MSAPLHSDLVSVLDSCKVESSAAEVHGSLCSLLCVYDQRAEEIWLQEVMPRASAENTAMAISRCRDCLRVLFIHTRHALDVADMSFAPLLPPDSESLATQARAVSDWTMGFLHGLGCAAAEKAVVARIERAPLQEIVQDMAAISRVDTDLATESEESSAALTEIVEYLRVTVQLAYEELARRSSGTASGPGVLH